MCAPARFAPRPLLAAIIATVGLSVVSARAEGPKPNLPLKKVVLFSSGVGYFQHDGSVADDAEVELKFRVDDVNDLLKSMVVQDLDGGSVSTVNYASKDPITKSLKSFAIDLTTNPTLASLLGQVRGERVELEAAVQIAGVIVGVEKQKKVVGDNQTVEFDVLNVLTDDGLRSVPLEGVSRIKLANPQLDAELRKALAVLATGHATDKKSVGVRFLGTGKRRAMIGYVQETPVWKTSYRLLLTDKQEPLLQGWAIVENTTEDDWSAVDLSLVSGRPISFKMDLYEPLYVARPNVQMELYSSLRPQVYEQDMERKEAEFADRARAPSLVAAAAAPAAPPMADGQAYGRALRRAGAQESLAAAKAGAYKLQLGGAGVASAAQAADVGELFQYVIKNPVSLPRQQSAMLPIVQAAVKAEKVSIYDPAVHAKHPLGGLRLTNSTALHLMQGPITVFDDGVYAGDARIQDLAPGSQRLVSYAMDLDTEVAAQSKGKPDELLSVRIVKGAMLVSRRYARTQEFTVKNSGSRAKTVLIEHPLDPQWTLVAPARPQEKTRDRYRFAVEAKPGQPATLAVEEQRVEREQLALTDLNDFSVQIYIASSKVGDKVKEALKEVVRRKSEIESLNRQQQELQGRMNEIGQEQSRMRQNMERLDRAGDLYKRYVKKFNDQEDEMERFRTDATALRQRLLTAQQELDRYLIALEVE